MLTTFQPFSISELVVQKINLYAKLEEDNKRNWNIESDKQVVGKNQDIDIKKNIKKSFFAE